jgi:hypothetical protein
MHQEAPDDMQLLQLNRGKGAPTGDGALPRLHPASSCSSDRIGMSSIVGGS